MNVGLLKLSACCKRTPVQCLSIVLVQTYMYVCLQRDIQYKYFFFFFLTLSLIAGATKDTYIHLLYIWALTMFTFPESSVVTFDHCSNFVFLLEINETTCSTRHTTVCDISPVLLPFLVLSVAFVLIKLVCCLLFVNFLSFCARLPLSGNLLCVCTEKNG